MPYGFYEFDRPIGLYGFESREQIANEVIREFGRYEQAAERAGTADSIIADLRGDLPAGEAHGLSTLVPNNAETGYALAVSPDHRAERMGTDGVHYTVDLTDRPEVVTVRSVFITHSSRIASTTARKTEADTLIHQFSKGELETIMRMIGKLATGLQLAEQYAGKTAHEMVAYSEARKRAYDAEPRVFAALQHYHLDGLAASFPGTSNYRREAAAVETPDVGTELILEWPELLESIDERFRRETDRSLPRTSIAIQSIVAGEHYVMRFQAQYGRLTKIQLLSWDGTGKGHWQEFDLRTNVNEDDIERLRIKPDWDRASLLQAVRHGEAITGSVYEGYLKSAALDPDMRLPTATVINLSEERKKRPAA